MSVRISFRVGLEGTAHYTTDILADWILWRADAHASI